MAYNPLLKRNLFKCKTCKHNWFSRIQPKKCPRCNNNWRRKIPFWKENYKTTKYDNNGYSKNKLYQERLNNFNKLKERLQNGL